MYFCVFNIFCFTQDMTVEVSPTERSLLGFFVAKIQKLDPDVVVVGILYVNIKNPGYVVFRVF